jgi:hypothetical protein
MHTSNFWLIHTGTVETGTSSYHLVLIKKLNLCSIFSEQINLVKSYNGVIFNLMRTFLVGSGSGRLRPDPDLDPDPELFLCVPQTLKESKFLNFLVYECTFTANFCRKKILEEIKPKLYLG